MERINNVLRFEGNAAAIRLRAALKSGLIKSPLFLFKMYFCSEGCEVLAQCLVFAQCRIFRKNTERFFACRFDKRDIGQRCHGKIGRAPLAVPEKIAGTAYREIFFREKKTIIAFKKRFQAPADRLRRIVLK